MIFCQACGAQNTVDAKFCNMCGARIAQAGEPGGPLPPGAKAPAGGLSGGTGSTSSGLHAAPNAMNNTTSITLAGMGVQSPARTWAILIGGAVLFLVVGAGGAWVAMRSAATPPPTTSTDDAELPPPVDPGPVEVGDPVPTGEETPDEGVIISSGPRVRERPRGTGGGGGAGGSGSGSGSGSAGGSGTGTGTETGTGTGTGTTPPPERDWGAMEETVSDEDRDLQMEHYSVQVRRFIRNYYVQRASACWDHESRGTGETVRGAVVIGFTIGADGHVQGANVTRNTTGRASLGQCLQRNVAGWQLPAPPRGEAVEMEMPFSR